ncbi:MAG: DUF5916 domain-containing protein [Bacteroidota bacterium]
MRKNTLVLMLAILASGSLYAQDETPTTDLADIPTKIYLTKRITGKAPKIDGFLDDPVWQTVEWGGDFSQLEPNDGGQPEAPTQFKILYDDAYLYVGYRMHDEEPDKIVRRMSRRDGFEGDWIEINIDSYHDKRSAFSFTVSASGVKGDEFISNNGNNWDESWNPIWYTRTNIDEKGWTAEVKIPLSQLRYGNKEEHIWGFQIHRRNFRSESRSLFQRIPRNSGVWVSAFAELHGITGIKPQKQIEIQPYLVGQTSTFEKEEGNPFLDGTDSDFTVGVDGKVGITSDMVLDFTINPDFGQVEADPAAVRLDGFQNFFQEQRPFFVENNNIFDFGITNSEAGGAYDSDNLFYSRRIGGSPHGSPNLASGEYAEIPGNASILGAAKFSGKTKEGLAIGILESVTAKEVAQIDLNGERREEVVEPLTNYFVGRVTKDFDGGNTVIGGIFTGVNRQLSDTNLDFLHKAAYSGGLDIVHRWKDQSWVATANFIYSNVQGSKEAITNTQTSFEHYFQRPDAEHLTVDENRTSLTGTGGTLKIGRFGGNWKFETGATWRSPELELNDIGFMNNADEINHFFWSGYRFNNPFGIFRNMGLNVNSWSRWDFGGRHLYQAANVNMFAQFKNFYRLFVGHTREFKDISNQALFGGPALRKSRGNAFFVNAGTDNRKKVRLGFNAFWARGNDTDQAKTVNAANYGVRLTIQPTDALRFSIRPNLGKFDRLMQHVTNVQYEGATNYLVSSLNQNTLSITLRLNYNITPNLTIQYYGEPFITRVRYFDFKRITNPTALLFHDRYAPLDAIYDPIEDIYSVDENTDRAIDYTFGDPNFSFMQFRSNLVARWEYVPGSELFLVFAQSTNNTGDPSEDIFPSLTDNLFNNQPTNIFLIKWTYRFLL